MNDPKRLLHPIWREDARSQAEDIEGIWKSQYDIYCRLKAQNAHPDLVRAAAQASEHLRQAFELSDDFTDWFPEEPPDAPPPPRPPGTFPFH